MKGEIPYILFLMKFFSNPKDFIFNLLFMRKNYKKRVTFLLSAYEFTSKNTKRPQILIGSKIESTR